MRKFILLTISVVSLFTVSNAEETPRYFGGFSENELILPKSSTYTVPLVVTEEVFVAKDAGDIDIVVEKLKQNDIDSGKSAKEFLEDKSGHLYGGLSEIKLNLKAQITQ